MSSKYEYDISFFEQRDKDLRELENKLELVSAKILLRLDKAIASDDPDTQQIVENLSENMPVRYNDGIFRVVSVGESEDSCYWEVEIYGTFSNEDPNGYTANGYTDDEEEARISVEYDGNAIADLEI